MKENNIRKPRISIVIPSYNQGRYIEQTIVSVLDQLYPNLQLIVMDGGSKDETIEVIKKYERHLSYWESVPDKGQTDAINKGFSKCTGDIFNWLNSDDYYQPGTLHTIAGVFEDPAVKVVAGTELAFEDGNPQKTVFHPGTVLLENWYETLRVGIYTQPCSFMRKKEAEKCFPLNISLRYVMDRELWWKFLLQNGQEGVKKIPEQLSNFRLHPSSKSVGEQDLFWIEFDRLKRSLFTQLGTPEYFYSPLTDHQSNLSVKWPVLQSDRTGILCAFASYYAGRAYVNDDLKATRLFIHFIKKHKGSKLNASELKMWMLSSVLPHSLVHTIKKIRQRH